MSDQFLGEIRIFGGNFAPFNWALCNGQILPITQNSALFSLLGTNFGGNGSSNFGLPNFQGAGPMNNGTGAGLSTRVMGETAGSVNVTLLLTNLAAHQHPAACGAAGGNTPSPVGAVWAEEKKGKAPTFFYSDGAVNPTAMSATVLGVAGGSMPHNNMAPYQVLTFIIALAGNFPTRG